MANSQDFRFKSAWGCFTKSPAFSNSRYALLFIVAAMISAFMIPLDTGLPLWTGNILQGICTVLIVGILIYLWYFAQIPYRRKCEVLHDDNKKLNCNIEDLKKELNERQQQIDELQEQVNNELIRDMMGWEVFKYIQQETEIGHGKSQREIEKIIRQAIVDSKITMWAKLHGSEVFSEVPKKLFTAHNSTHKIVLEPEGCGGTIRCEGGIGGGEVWRLPMFYRKQIESVWPPAQANGSDNKAT